MLTLIRCYYKRNIDALEIYSKDFIIGILSNFILCAAEILMLVFVFRWVDTSTDAFTIQHKSNRCVSLGMLLY